MRAVWSPSTGGVFFPLKSGVVFSQIDIRAIFEQYLVHIRLYPRARRYSVVTAPVVNIEPNIIEYL